MDNSNNPKYRQAPTPAPGLEALLQALATGGQPMGQAAQQPPALLGGPSIPPQPGMGLETLLRGALGGQGLSGGQGQEQALSSKHTVPWWKLLPNLPIQDPLV